MLHRMSRWARQSGPLFARRRIIKILPSESESESGLEYLKTLRQLHGQLNISSANWRAFSRYRALTVQVPVGLSGAQSPLLEGGPLSA